MEVTHKIILEDLKYNFSKYLNKDFFGKRLKYYLRQDDSPILDIDSLMPLGDQLLDKYKVKEKDKGKQVSLI